MNRNKTKNEHLFVTKNHVLKITNVTEFHRWKCFYFVNSISFGLCFVNLMCLLKEENSIFYQQLYECFHDNLSCSKCWETWRNKNKVSKSQFKPLACKNYKSDDICHVLSFSFSSYVCCNIHACATVCPCASLTDFASSPFNRSSCIMLVL